MMRAGSPLVLALLDILPVVLIGHIGTHLVPHEAGQQQNETQQHAHTLANCLCLIGHIGSFHRSSLGRRVNRQWLSV